MKIGFMGVGAMGSAIVKGLAANPAGPETLYGYDVSADKLAQLGAETGLKAVPSPLDLAKSSDWIVLCVKPHQVAGVLAGMDGALSGKVMVSIAAGLTVSRLKELSKHACPVVRVMPNTPALVGAGVFAVCVDDPALTASQKTLAVELFKPCGQVFALEERLFDAFTAVCGSGPAYVFAFMDALVEAAVTLGLTRDQSTAMVKGLFSGSSKLAEESSLHLQQLREMVTSPGGTTIAACVHMDRMAVRASIIDAVKAAYLRSVELAKS